MLKMLLLIHKMIFLSEKSLKTLQFLAQVLCNSDN